jgi:hypothetical protein
MSMTATVSHPLVSLDRQAADVSGRAFEAAWAVLCSSGARLTPPQACNARVRLARAILEGVQAGERDSARLRDRALSSLAKPDAGETANQIPYL